MNQLPCGTIQDLLPGYLDGVVNSVTRQAVEEHLEKCAACRKLCVDMGCSLGGEELSGVANREQSVETAATEWEQSADTGATEREQPANTAAAGAVDLQGASERMRMQDKWCEMDAPETLAEVDFLRKNRTRRALVIGIIAALTVLGVIVLYLLFLR